MPRTAHDPPTTAGSLRAQWWRIALLLLGLLWVGSSLWGRAQERTLAYSEFERRLGRGELAELRVAEHEITGLIRAPHADVPPPGGVETAPPVTGTAPARAEQPFRTLRIEDPALLDKLAAADVEYSGVVASGWGETLLIWALPVALFVLVLLAFGAAGRRPGSQMLGFGRSRARLAPETGTGVTFADVAGCDEAKLELSEVVEFLRRPARFVALGARIPKGVLLLGPPGTGKTLLARAVAGESGVPFFLLTGSEFVEMFVGVGAARVRDLFVQAKQRAPCIVFIDEIDAVGRQRGVSMGVVNDEREQTLNQLLAEMDGFEVNSGVIVLAATNRPEVLDRALLRPGRFDRQIVLDAPDVAGRLAVLQVHARHNPLAPDVDLRRIAEATPGMSGADLANALNEAALRAAREGHHAITQADLDGAVEKVVVGPERRSRRLSDTEKQRVAYHESGHALATAYLEHVDPLRKVSVVPRGRAALGFTLSLPVQEQFLHTRTELLERLQVMLAGRAAEQLALGEVSTGAQDDLEGATSLARRMVCLFGMDDRIGLAQCARPATDAWLEADGALRRDCSEATAREIDEEVRVLLERAHSDVELLLRAHRPQLERVATRLLEVETLDRAALNELLPSRAPTPSGALARAGAASE